MNRYVDGFMDGGWKDTMDKTDGQLVMKQSTLIMNYKIILVLLCICLFAGVMGALNLFSDKGLTLDDAFVNGKIVFNRVNAF